MIHEVLPTGANVELVPALMKLHAPSKKADQSISGNPFVFQTLVSKIMIIIIFCY